MFPFPIATPTNCDIQTFYGSNITSGQMLNSWTKPVGVSHVYMMLIGSGGAGDTGNGGGSGAVTVWYGAAQHVPNSLVIQAGSGSGGTSSFVYFRTTSTSLSVLLTATCASQSTGGAAMTANSFTASGFFQSVAGQDGGVDNPGGSASTFLGAGTGTAGLTNTANYGYALINSGANHTGSFQMQPIIVGLGSKSTGRGAIGCGGGANGAGGHGMVLIASW